MTCRAMMRPVNPGASASMRASIRSANRHLLSPSHGPMIPSAPASPVRCVGTWVYAQADSVPGARGSVGRRHLADEQERVGRDSADR